MMISFLEIRFILFKIFVIRGVDGSLFCRAKRTNLESE